nr:reverse transcriptase domain-containing protein [Tanacetum cinerariifolium]
MTTSVEKRNNNKFCEFHEEVGHNTNECMHLRRQIKELMKAGKLSHVIKELKQGSGKDQPKAAKKGETSIKDKPLTILMVQPCVWFDDLPPESVDSYDDLKKEFLVNFLQQKKCVKDPAEIHHIKQREGESTEDFMRRFKAESKHVKGASECMRISGFMYGITNTELIKRLHNNILRLVDEMIRVTTTFLKGEVAASNQ